jgi:short-subunit dehydrogenase
MEFKMKPVALITGASSGIGFELAKVFAQEGYDLIVTADKGIRNAAQKLSALGAEVESYEVDLTKENGVDELTNFVQQTRQVIDVAVLNAGAGVGGQFATETDLSDEERIIKLNCLSTVQLAKWVVKEMLEHGHGHILFTSSVVGVMPSPLQSVYGATKAFVHSFAEGLRIELKESGISVTALQPGATETNFFDGPGLRETKVGQAKKDDPAKVARQGYEALMDGEDHIVAGSFKNKIQIAINKFLPEGMKGIATRSYAEKVDH